MGRGRLTGPPARAPRPGAASVGWSPAAWTAAGVLAFLLAACGEASVPAHGEARSDATASAAPADLQPSGRQAAEGGPAPAGGQEADEDSARRAVCVARALPAQPPATPARHFRLSGTARFVLHDTERPPIEQGLEIALGGPARQRYTLDADGRKNWFLLDGADEAWMKGPDAAEPRAYPAAELAEDAGLRWLILRFPWDVAALPEQPDAPLDWRAAWARSPLRIERDARGLPVRVLRLPEPDDSSEPPDAGELEPVLELEDWRPADVDGDGVAAAAYPHRWIWHRAQFRLEEEFHRVQPGALYLGRAFRPLAGAPEAYRIRRGEDGAVAPVPDEALTLVDRSAWWLREQDADAAQRAGADARWQVHPGDGALAFTALTFDTRPSGAAEASRLDAQRCLLWTSPDAPPPAARIRAELVTAAEQNGLRPDGALWLRLDAPGLEALLPVTEQP